MMKKFWYLTGYGLKKKMKSKAFLISNAIIFLLLIAVFNIDSIIMFFGGTFDVQNKIYVIDESNEFYDSFNENYKQLKISISEEATEELIKTEKTKEELQEEIIGTTDIIIELLKDDENYLKANVITENYIDTLTYQSIIQTINNTKYEKALLNSNIDINELNEISRQVEINRIILDETKTTEEENMNTIMSVVFPTIIFPFFMLIILLVQLIGGEINEEKTTRSMEVIISNVPVKVHFYSKLVANNVFIISQAIIIFLYGLFGFFTRTIFGGGIGSEITNEIGEILKTISNTGIIDKLYYIIPLTIFMIILSFIAYSLIAGILASMTTNPEDFQQIQTPIMLILMASYFLSTMSGMFNGSEFIKFLSYVPLISFLLSPALLLIGQIGVIDVTISVIALLVFNVVLTKYGLKIYKIGILNYSTEKMWSKIFKATKM